MNKNMTTVNVTARPRRVATKTVKRRKTVWVKALGRAVPAGSIFPASARASTGNLEIMEDLAQMER